MIISIDANSMRLRIAVHQTRSVTEFPSLAILCEPNGKIVALGDEAASLERQLPEELKIHCPNFVVIHPLDLEQFNPRIAALVVVYFLWHTYKTIHKSNLMLLYAMFVHPVNLDLQIWGYDKLKSNDRAEFEYILKKESLLARRLAINGRFIKRPWFEKVQNFIGL